MLHFSDVYYLSLPTKPVAGKLSGLHYYNRQFDRKEVTTNSCQVK